jgi:hypothetical protein
MNHVLSTPYSKKPKNADKPAVSKRLAIVGLFIAGLVVCLFFII